jgi:hypothetical protein
MINITYISCLLKYNIRWAFMIYHNLTAQTGTHNKKTFHQQSMRLRNSRIIKMSKLIKFKNIMIKLTLFHKDFSLKNKWSKVSLLNFTKIFFLIKLFKVSNSFSTTQNTLKTIHKFKLVPSNFAKLINNIRYVLNKNQKTLFFY